MRCHTAFVSGPHIARVGDVFDAADPIVSVWPEAFEPVNGDQRATPVEAASAAPGEKRSVGRPKKKVAGDRPGSA